MARRKVISLEQIAVSCRNCNLASSCLPAGLEPEDVRRLDRIVRRNRPLHRGDSLFRTTDPFHCLYVVRTGAVKTFMSSAGGGEQILGFYLPGEIIGLDGIQDKRHHYSAEVLETSALCMLPFHSLAQLGSNIQDLQHQIYRLLSKEIRNDAEMLLLLGKKNAEERLATFMLSLSARFRRRGLSATDFYLSMSRHEIGNHLGLAIETVSRLLTHFQKEGLLQVERRHILLTDPERLRAITHGQDHEGQQVYPSG